jgi:hypothetical protein
VIRSNQKLLFLGTFLVVAGGLAACISWQDERELSSSSPTSQLSPSSELDDLAPPTIPRPEEQERYLDATIQGDQRAIALIDAALERARARSDSTPGYIEILEKVRRERVRRQTRYLAERR